MGTLVMVGVYLLVFALLLWALGAARGGRVPPSPPAGGGGLSGPDREWLARPPGGVTLSGPERDAERERRGRARAHSLGRRGNPNDLAPWDRL